MTKIAINLLPLEFKDQEIKTAKFYKIQTLGILVILLMIVISSLTVALRFLQSKKVVELQSKFDQAEQKVSSFKNSQASLLILKNRLIAINQYWQSPSKQTLSYGLISKLIPPSVSVSSISVDNSGEVLITAQAPDGATMDSVITNLTSQDINQDKISQVALDSVNRGQDGIYRLSLKISTK